MINQARIDACRTAEREYASAREAELEARDRLRNAGTVFSTAWAALNAAERASYWAGLAVDDPLLAGITADEEIEEHFPETAVGRDEPMREN